MVLVSKKQQSNVSKRSKDNSYTNFYTSKRRSCKDVNMKKNVNLNNLETLSRLLCKPVSINITRLSAAELKRLSEINEYGTQKNGVKNNKRPTRERLKIKENRTRTLYNTRKNIQSQIVSTHKKTTAKNHNLETENLLKSVKQPYVKLYRIDKVIDKIAQTFARVGSNKEYKVSKQENYIKDTQTEISTLASEPSELSPIKINKNKNLTCNSHISKTFQSNQYIQNDQHNSSDDDKICKDVKGNFKRKRRITYDSDDDINNSENVNNNSHRVIITEVKTLKLNSSKEEINKEYNAIKIKHNVNRKIQGGNASTFVPSDFVYVTEESVPQKLEDDSSANVKQSTLCNKGTEEQMKASFISDKDLIQKYKLFKELRVFLIKLDSIKCSLGNKYSTMEVEQLTKTYMDFLVNSDLNIQQRLSLFNYKRMKVEKNEKSVHHRSPLVYPNGSVIRPKKPDKYNIAECTEQKPVFNSSTCENENNNVSIKVSKVQNILLSTSKEDNSGKRFEQDISNNLEQTSISSLKASISNNSELSHFSNNGTLEALLSKNSSKKSNRDMRSSENAEANTSKTISSNKLIPNHNEKVLISGRKMFVTKIRAKTINIINPKVNTKKNSPTCYPSIISPTKHKKFMDKKDNHKSINYKCIVCDHYFEDYSALQHHLSVHAQKHNNVLPNSSTEFNSSEKLQQTVLYASKSKRMESFQCSEQESIQQIMPIFSTDKNNKQQWKKHSSTKSSQNKTKNHFSRKQLQFVDMLRNSTKCSICSQVFPTTDLAAHIFLHTENELQKAYESAKQEISKTNKEKEKYKQIVTEKVNTKVSNDMENVNHVIEKSVKVVSEKEKLPTVEEQGGSLVTQDSEIILSERAIINTFKRNKSPVLNENSFKGIHFTQSKLEEEKANKVDNIKKSFTICDCHNKPGTNKNYLHIEIDLFCHICRVLFRSIECFQTHYCLPEHEICNENRFNRGQFPNLFCVTCGMMFSSVQDVRHHLEIHACSKLTYTVDFRCNICKIAFIGIGSLFYIHWLKHVKDPFWIASEQSFPKNSVINLKAKHIDKSYKQNKITSNKSMEEYIHVAEYICHKCKLSFVTENDLKKHDLKCKVLHSVKDKVGKHSDFSVQKALKIQLTCSLCKDVFTEKIPFYRHIRNKHNFNTDPQYFCISLAVIKTAFICNICMELTESIDDFEDHWLKHSTTHIYFTCTYCKKAYCNNLNSFLEHAKGHNIKIEDVVSCTVNYQDTEFVCKFCDIGFESQTAFHEHDIIHKLNYPVVNSKDDEVLSQEISASIPEMNHTSSHSKPKELTIKKQKKDFMENEVSTNLITKEKNQESLTISTKNKDKEKLINILEGNEDDSENELIIDLTEKPEEQNELSKEERIKEKQTTFDHALNIFVKSVVVQASPQNDTISQSSKNIASTSSHVTISDPKTCISTSETPHTTSNSTNSLQSAIFNTVGTENQKKNNPSKPKQEFLRVKTLAELRGDIKLEICEMCGFYFEDYETYIQHLFTCNVSHQEKEHSDIAMKNLHSDSLQSNSFGESLSSVSQNVLNTLSPSLSSLLYQKSSVSEKQFVQPPTNSQQSQQIQLYMNQDKHLPASVSSLISAYHKNLPACNIVRTTTALPRSSTQKAKYTPTKQVTSSTDIQNLWVTNSTSCSSNKHIKVPCVNKVINSNETDLIVSSLQTSVSCIAEENKKSNNVSNSMAMTTVNTINDNQNCKQYLPTILNQSETNCASSNVSYQYPYLITNNLNNSNEMTTSRPITENASTIYYNNSNYTSGGMSVIISQTTPVIQNMPTIGFLQQQEQQQTYQTQIYNNPVTIVGQSCVLQSQDV